MRHSAIRWPGRMSPLVSGALAIGLVCSVQVAAAPPLQASSANPDPSTSVHAAQERQFGSTHVSPHQGTVSPHVVSPAVSGPAREVFGFAPYWGLSDWQEWHLSLLTTIAYFGITYDGNGNAVNDSGWSGWQSSNLTNLINAAHTQNVHVLVTVKCFDDATMNSIVGSPANSQNAINNAINWAKSKGLDGVDMDFEGQTSTQFPNLTQQFSAFATSLANQVHNAMPGSEVVADTYSGSAGGPGFFNVTALAPSLDALFVMAYDMSLANNPSQASATAPLNGGTYNDGSAVAQYVAAVGASKVILGVPYYGYKWNVPAPTANATTTSGATADPYSGVLSDFACAQQLSQSWDSTAASPWATWFSPGSGDPCGGNFNSWRELYYDNASSLGSKYDLVNMSNLRGTGMWALSFDAGSSDLWNEIAAKINVAHGNIGSFSAAGSTGGYFTLTQSGGIYSYGDAVYQGNLIDHLYAHAGPAVGIAATPDGGGYAIATSDGGLYTFGDATYQGNLIDRHIAHAAPVSGITYTRTGRGYWILTSDGGVYAFGDASYYGNPIDHNYSLGGPATAISATITGYAITSAGGQLYTFNAPYYGTFGDHPQWNAGTLSGLAYTGDGGGYLLASQAGGVYALGDAPYFGSNISNHYPGNVTGIATTP